MVSGQKGSEVWGHKKARKKPEKSPKKSPVARAFLLRRGPLRVLKGKPEKARKKPEKKPEISGFTDREAVLGETEDQNTGSRDQIHPPNDPPVQ